METKLNFGHHPDFSEREAQLLKLASAGYTTAEIASVLGISGPTVNTYWNRIRAKVGVRSRQEILKAVHLPAENGRNAKIGTGDLIGIAHLRRDGSFCWVNAHWQAMFGGDSRDWVDRPFAEFARQTHANMDVQPVLSQQNLRSHLRHVECEIEFGFAQRAIHAARLTCAAVSIPGCGEELLTVVAEPVDDQSTLHTTEPSPHMAHQDDCCVLVLSDGGLIRACSPGAERLASLTFEAVGDQLIWDVLVGDRHRQVLLAGFHVALDVHKPARVIADLMFPTGDRQAASFWFSPMAGQPHSSPMISCLIRLPLLPTEERSVVDQMWAEPAMW